MSLGAQVSLGELVLNSPSVPSSLSLRIQSSAWPELSELPIVEGGIVLSRGLQQSSSAQKTRRKSSESEDR